VKDEEKGVRAIMWVLRFTRACQEAIDTWMEVALRYHELGRDDEAFAMLYDVHNITGVVKSACSRLERILEGED
jgi:hypothetical protein